MIKTPQRIPQRIGVATSLTPILAIFLWSSACTHVAHSPMATAPNANSVPPRNAVTLTSAGSEERDLDSPRNPGERAEWRYRNRAGPNGVIPPNALLLAKEHADNMPTLKAPAPTGMRDGGIWQWDWLGPGNVGGRVRAILIHPQDPDRMWCAGVQGGVWRTTNAGASWEPLTDFIASIAVSCLAMDPQNPDILYAGTGESYASDGVPGSGIFKSTDGGDHWSVLCSTATYCTPTIANAWTYVNRIAVHQNGLVVLAATGTVGSIGGIYKSIDGGNTWGANSPSFNDGNAVWAPSVAREDPNNTNSVLFGPGVSDIKFRTGDFAVAGTFDGRVLYSADAGTSWSVATFASSPCPAFTRVSTAFSPDADPNPDPNMPSYVDDQIFVLDTAGFNIGDRVLISGASSETTRIRDVTGISLIVDDLTNSYQVDDTICSIPCNRVEIAVAPSDPLTVYAAMDLSSGTIWRSVDGGVTFSLRSSGPYSYLSDQGDYDNAIWVNPLNRNRIVVGGINLYRSIDGGLNLEQISDWTREISPGDSAHADQHVIVSPSTFSAENPRIYVGNDGGVYRCDDVFANPASSVIQSWIDMNNNLGITQFYGGAVSTAQRTLIGGTQDNDTVTYQAGTTWHQSETGDGGMCVINPIDDDICYGEYVHLRIEKSTDGGLTWSHITDPSDPTSLTDAGDKTLSNFIAPIAIDPSAPDTVWAGGTRIWRTTDGGATWDIRRAPLASSSNCSAIAVDPTTSDVVWLGYNDGTVTKGNPGDWVDVDDNGTTPIPEFLTVTDIAINANNTDEVYVTLGGYISNAVWYTNDGGATWQQRTGSGNTALPPAHANTITIHPVDSSWVYVGTDLGVYVSEDKGLHWNRTPLFDQQNPFPHDGPVNVEVADLFWMPGLEYLFAATHGRGMFRVRPFAVVYVDGIDGGGTIEDGSQPFPFDLVMEGYDAAGDGTTISIRPTVYDEADPSAHLILNKRVTLIANQLGSVEIK